MQDIGSIAGGFAGSLPGSAAGGLPGGTLAGGPGFGMDRLLMAERLGLVMARRAAEILDRHRESLAPDARPGSLDGTSTGGGDVDRFALDDAIFTAVLDATNECLGPFDSRPPADRWCDALLHLLDLARYTEEG
ncbi:MAG: hypothetical protein JWM19_3586 [Actinomycetia bacterium]|nr:hypothetical protein [Actinomycetes bacterium]